MVRHPKVRLENGGAKLASGCLLMRLAPDARPEPIFSHLRQTDSIRWIDAVRGAWEILAAVETDSRDSLQNLVSRVGEIEGLAAVELLQLVRPALPASLELREDEEEEEESLQPGPGPATLYATIELEQERLDAVYAEVAPIEEVRDLVAIEGGGLFARIQAADFNVIRTMLNDSVRYIDGVLRINELMVVSM